MQFAPSIILKRFVKSYSVIVIDRDLTGEVFYPSGYIDFVVNISGTAATIINGRHKSTPAVELLGHLTLPTRVTAAKGSCVLIARLFPYAGPLFFPHPINDFTNYATDLSDVFSQEIDDFYDRLINCLSIADKVRELDNYLIRKLKGSEDRYRRALFAAEIYSTIIGDGEKLAARDLAAQYGFSERYVQKLFLENVGLSPASLYSVTRFNKALELILGSPQSLTGIAYECGYYDQAHFIREFKKFTGIRPLEARRSLTGNEQALQQAVNIGF